MFAICKKIKVHDIVVLSCASCIRLLICGLWFTPGILYVAFRDEFQYSSGVTSWITTLQYFISSIMCAVGGLLIKRFGSRLITMVGGLILTCGLVTSMLASHIVHVFITFGVLSGIGSGFSYIGSMEAINVQFGESRSLLFGLCAFIANLGVVFYPPLLQTLINAYTWRGMFLIIGALELNIIVGAIVYSPRTRNHKVVKNVNTKSESYDAEDGAFISLLAKANDIKEGDNMELTNYSEERTISIQEKRDDCYQLDNIIASDNLEEKEKTDTNVDHNGKARVKISCDKSENEIGRSKTEKQSFLQINSFLKNPRYYVYMISGTLFLFGTGIILGHLSAYTLLNKLTDKIGASVLYTINAVSMATAKLIQGFILSNNRLKPVTLHIIATAVGGLFTFVFLLNIPLPVLYVYVVVFGASNATLGGALLPMITIAMSGGDNFAFALGIVACVTAVGNLLGAPTAGWIFDVTQSYTIPFLVAAIAMTSSSLVMLLSCYRGKPTSSENAKDSK